MKLNKLLLVLTLAALLIAPAGCIFSPDDDGPTEPTDTGVKPATTKDILMQNFEIVYEDMDIDGFTDMLHPQYKSILLPETQAEWGWSDDYYFDYTTELTIHRKMFGGVQGLDSHGNTIHPIATIEVNLLEQQQAWLDIPDDDIDFGGFDGEYAPFRVTIEFFDANLSHKFLVQQQVYFYVIPVEEGGRSIFKMLGQRGLPIS